MKYIKLEEVCSIITDGTHQTPTYSTNGYVFLSSKNVTSGKIDWKNVKYIDENLHQELRKRVKPQKNDILLAKNGTTGVAALVDKDDIFDIYVSLALLRPIDAIYPQYLLYVINSPQTKFQFDKNLKGIGVKNLHLKEIRRILIPIMPIDNQKKIVKILDKAQELIDKRKEQLESLDELVKSRFIEMFGDPIINSKNYDMVSLGKMSELITKGASPNWQGIEYIEDDKQTLFVTSENVREGYLDFEKKKYLQDKFNEKQKRSVLKKGDFLINIVGVSIGRAAQFNLDVKANINQAVALVRLKKGFLNDKYLLTYLNSEKALQMYSKMQVSVARANLSLQNINDLEIILPPIELQNQFATFVNQVDKLKFEAQKSLTEMENNFNSLMQRAFK